MKQKFSQVLKIVFRVIALPFVLIVVAITLFRRLIVFAINYLTYGAEFLDWTANRLETLGELLDQMYKLKMEYKNRFRDDEEKDEWACS